MADRGTSSTDGPSPSPSPSSGGPRLLLVSSSGGVLEDLLALRPWWGELDRRWVAVRSSDTEQLLADEQVTWRDDVTTSSPLRLRAAVDGAARDLAERPADLVVSAGTAVAVPYFVAARRSGVASWWVETFNMVGDPGRAARLCAALATRTLVQRPELLVDRPRAVLVGELY